MQASSRSPIASKKRAISEDDSKTDEEEVQRLRAKKGKAPMTEQPKKKKSRAELDENILAERQRRGFELRTTSTPPVIASKSSEILELNETIKKMDARISAQAKIIRAQSARIDDQDDIVKDMHTIITYQGVQIDFLSQAFSRFSKEVKGNKDVDDDDDAGDADKNNEENTEGDKDAGDKDAGDKNAGGESTCR